MASMVWAGIPCLLLALFLAASPRELLAEDRYSFSVNGVRLSATSYRNLTGHWITKAVLTRRSTTDFSDWQHRERPLEYDVDVTRESYGDDETLTTTITVIAPPTRVGSDYKFIPNIGYYKLHTDKKNWTNARTICAKEGAHLAIVNSEAEENAIREVMRAHSNDGFNAFIGFHDMLKEGEYVTIFGDPLSSTGRVRWEAGQPNNMIDSNQEDQDCGTIHTDGTISDLWCSNKRTFVCEQSL